MKKKTGLIVTAVFFSVLLIAVLVAYSKIHVYGALCETPPECGKSGSTYHICRLCGKVEYLEALPALSHEFGETVRNIRYETAHAVCARCGEIENREYIPPETIPRLYIEGTPGGTLIPVVFRYVDGAEEQSGFAQVSVNGSIDRVGEKPDYNLSLYTDNTYSEAASLNFGTVIGETSALTLHADYLDASGGAVNLAVAALWENTVKTRKNIDRHLETLPHLGADAGKPILLYTNGNFKGIYTLSLPDNGEMFGLHGDNGDGLLYTYTLFGKAPYSVTADGVSVPVTVKHPSNGDEAKKYTDSFQRMLNFAETASESDFADRIERYLDTDAVMDYMIYLYVTDAQGHELLKCNYVTYDGQKWIPSPYAVENAFQFNENSRDDATLLPSGTGDEARSGLSFTLFDRILRHYGDRIFARYHELRSTVLSNESMAETFAACRAALTEEILNAEFEEYPNRARNQAPATLDAAWFSSELSALDAYFGFDSNASAA